jgi:phosphatidylglycerophosphate synthase
MAIRLNTSLLAVGERALLTAIVRRLPPWTTPNHLTALGLLGAVVTAASFVFCHWSWVVLPLVVFGLFLNWFGDSLDGSLARYRGIERHRYGFFLDHSSDLIAQTVIVIGLGVSPYFTMSSALFVLSLYLLMSSYTYLKVVTHGSHTLSYGGLGATEFRIMVALWAVFAEWAGPAFIHGRIMQFAGLDVVIGALSALTFIFFIFMVRHELWRLEKEEEKAATLYKLPSQSVASHTKIVDDEFSQAIGEQVSEAMAASV